MPRSSPCAASVIGCVVAGAVLRARRLDRLEVSRGSSRQECLDFMRADCQLQIRYRLATPGPMRHMPSGMTSRVAISPAPLRKHPRPAATPRAPFLTGETRCLRSIA